MVPGLAERFFRDHSYNFIRRILDQRGAPDLPGPPESPFNMPPELLALHPWATNADVAAYAERTDTRKRSMPHAPLTVP
jgi:hypothetical protein